MTKDDIRMEIEGSDILSTIMFIFSECEGATLSEIKTEIENVISDMCDCVIMEKEEE